jgi:hypothetical protein
MRQHDHVACVTHMRQYTLKTRCDSCSRASEEPWMESASSS